MNKRIAGLLVVLTVLTSTVSTSMFSKEASADVLVKDQQTIYKVENGVKRPFPSLASYLSYGYQLKDVRNITTAELNLPNGAIMELKDGALISDRGTIYTIEHGKKRGIVSREVFNAFGYSMNNVISADLGSVPMGAVIDSAMQRHPRGTLITYEGTIYFMGSDYKYPHSSAAGFLSWGNRWQDVVQGNEYDLAVPTGPIMGYKDQPVVVVPEPQFHHPDLTQTPVCVQEKGARLAELQSQDSSKNFAILSGKISYNNPNFPLSQFTAIAGTITDESRVHSDGSFCVVAEKGIDTVFLSPINAGPENFILAFTALPHMYDHYTVTVDVNSTAIALLVAPYLESDPTADIDELYELAQTLPEGKQFITAFEAQLRQLPAGKSVDYLLDAENGELVTLYFEALFRMYDEMNPGMFGSPDDFEDIE